MKNTKKLGLFDFLNDINKHKENLLKDNEEAEKAFSPFIVNLMLSYHIDAVAIVNELNCRSNMSKKMQYDFLIGAVRKGNRWSKITKPPNNEDVKMIMEFYNYSESRAIETLRIVNDEFLASLQAKTDVGGIVK